MILLFTQNLERKKNRYDKNFDGIKTCNKFDNVLIKVYCITNNTSAGEIYILHTLLKNGVLASN